MPERCLFSSLSGVYLISPPAVWVFSLSKKLQLSFRYQHRGSSIQLDRLQKAPKAQEELAKAGISPEMVRQADRNQDGRLDSREAFYLADDFDRDGSRGSLVDHDAQGQPTQAGKALGALGLLLERRDLQPDKAFGPDFERQHASQAIDPRQLAGQPGERATLARAGLTTDDLRAADRNGDGLVDAHEAFFLADDADRDGTRRTLIAADGQGRRTRGGQILDRLGDLLARHGSEPEKARREAYSALHDGRIDLDQLEANPQLLQQLTELGVDISELRGADRAGDRDGTLSAREAFHVADGRDHDGSRASLDATLRGGERSAAGKVLDRLGVLLDNRDLRPAPETPRPAPRPGPVPQQTLTRQPGPAQARTLSTPARPTPARTHSTIRVPGEQAGSTSTLLAVQDRLDRFSRDYGKGRLWKSPNPGVPGNKSPDLTGIPGTSGKSKCNLFVLDVLYQAGFEVPSYGENGKGWYPIATELKNFSEGKRRFFDVVSDFRIAGKTAARKREGLDGALRSARPGDLLTINRRGADVADNGHVGVVVNNRVTENGTIETAEAQSKDARLVTRSTADFFNDEEITILRPVRLRDGKIPPG